VVADSITYTLYVYTHTHTHTYICVCVCVRARAQVYGFDKFCSISGPRQTIPTSKKRLGT